MRKLILLTGVLLSFTTLTIAQKANSSIVGKWVCNGLRDGDRIINLIFKFEKNGAGTAESEVLLRGEKLVSISDNFKWSIKRTSGKTILTWISGMIKKTYPSGEEQIDTATSYSKTTNVLTFEGENVIILSHKGKSVRLIRS